MGLRLRIPEEIDAVAELSTVPKTSPFLKPLDEWFMLAVPWFGIALTLVFWLLGSGGLNFFELTGTKTMVIISLFAFADVCHVTLTYVLLLEVPELRQWRKNSNSFGLVARALAIGSTFVGIFWYLKASPVSASMIGMAELWFFINFVIPSHHTLAQIKGISYCYNSAIQEGLAFTTEEKKSARKNERIEKNLFYLLFLGDVLFWVPMLMKKSNVDVTVVQSVQNVGVFLLVAACVGLLANAYFFPHQGRSKKLNFLTRVTLYPMNMFSVVAGVFTRAAHGTEYMIIFRRMVQGSKMPNSKKLRALVIGVVVSLAYLVPYLIASNNVRTLASVSDLDVIVIASLTGTFVVRFVHFYLDSVIFRMSDSHTRAVMKPLLTSQADFLSK